MQPRISIPALFLLLLIGGSATTDEGQETFDYDAAGRIIRIQHLDGTRTHLEYDASGNLLSVHTSSVEKPPRITAAHPTELHASESHSLEIEGENLDGAEVIPPTSHFSVSGLTTQPSSLSFSLSLSPDTPLGDHILRVTNPDGVALLEVSVLPALPRLSAAPLPLALPEDGSVHAILIRLSHEDSVDRPVQLSTSDPAIAELLDASVIIPAGETEAPVQIRGVSGGVTTLTLSSAELEPATFSVYVTAAYGSINTMFSSSLGLIVGDLGPPLTEPPEGTVWSPAVGVTVGGAIRGLDPRTLHVGVSAATVRIQGINLPDLDGVFFAPAEGIAVEGLNASSNGTGATVVVSVDAFAPLGPRRLIVNGNGHVFPPVLPGADLLDITLPPPRIDSIEPLFAYPGATGQQLLVRGHHLSDPLAVVIEPTQGLEVGVDLETNPDGTLLYARFSVAPDAAAGERVVTVITRAGASSAIPSAANRLHLVDRPGRTYSPVSSPLLGIEIGSQGQPSVTEYDKLSPALGVSLGPVLRGLVPSQGEIGTELELELRGVGLRSVDTLRLIPSDGIALGEVEPDPTGERLNVRMEIAPDARKTSRRVRAFAAGAEIAFAAPSQARFSVTGPLPRLSSITPNTLHIGSGEHRFELRGENISGVTSLSAHPPHGLLLGPPEVNEDGRLLSLTISADQEAAPGARVLRLSTPAGSSTATAGPANRLFLHHDAQESVAPLASALLGVRVGEPPQIYSNIVDLPTTLLGIQVGEDEPPPYLRDRLIAAPALGLGVGTVITRVQIPLLSRAASHQVRLTGHGLHGVDGAGVFPALGVTASTPFVFEDGTEVAFSLSVSPDADLKPRALRLVAGAELLPYANSKDALLHLGAGVPHIDSIQPIVAQPGDVLELLVRGHTLQGAKSVSAEPPGGLLFDISPTVNEPGTELRVRVQVSEDAPKGPRVIRIQSPGGLSTDQSSPANTFTLH